VEDSETDPELPASVLPYKKWNRMMSVALKCEEVSTPRHSIKFDLPEYGVCDDDEKMITHLTIVVNEGLSERGVTDFKFGISFTPHVRFTHYADYQHLKKMVICGVSEQPDRIGYLETLAIRSFRCDHRCRNIKPGGESADHGVSPFFLYAVFGNAAAFQRGRDASRACPYVDPMRERS
jgi:hypothetical protein